MIHIRTFFTLYPYNVTEIGKVHTVLQAYLELLISEPQIPQHLTLGNRMASGY